jgi:hypothetical protein
MQYIVETAVFCHNSPASTSTWLPRRTASSVVGLAGPRMGIPHHAQDVRGGGWSSTSGSASRGRGLP